MCLRDPFSNCGAARSAFREDIEGVYQYFSSGKLAPAFAEITFDEISDGIERLKRGELAGRLVAKIAE